MEPAFLMSMSMGIPIEVEGLQAWLRDVPDGSLVVLDGQRSLGPSVLVERLMASARSAGRSSIAIRTGAPLEPSAERATAGADHESEWSAVESAIAGADVAVDSASLLALPLEPAALAHSLRRMQTAARKAGTIGIFCLENGVLDTARDTIFHLMADGLILFRARDDDDGIVPFLHVAKWPRRPPVNQHVFFTVEGSRLLVDTRKRVV